MSLSSAPLTDDRLDEVIAFLDAANPFAEKTWGWDTGRFIDWRWSGNSLRAATDPGWFARNCRIFEADGVIRAVAVAEYGGSDVCVLTVSEDRETVGHVVDRLLARRSAMGERLRFECSHRAGWLRELFAGAGFSEEVCTGHEWEYDLATVDLRAVVAEGFEVASLADRPDVGYDAIADCIAAAFAANHDIAAELRSLESNPRFLPELSVFALDPQRRVAAYCRGTVNAGNGVAGIDPVCTHPDFQRLGLAKAVVRTCFRGQRALGARFSYIGSAPEPDPSTRLYRSLGPVSRMNYCAWST